MITSSQSNAASPSDVEVAAAAAAAKIPSPKFGGMQIPRPAKHWTPRYIKNRVKLAIWQRQNPAAPWLTANAVLFL